MFSVLAGLFAVAILLPLLADGFGSTLVTASSRPRKKWRLLFSTAPTTTRLDDAPEIVVSSTPPSWEDLSAAIHPDKNKSEEEPVLTLYRDTNGWCPFCERVWVALRAKNLPYRERLISLQDKPEWYKELVPTTLVPAVLFHDEEKEKPERRIVWESNDIMKALDDDFPATPRLVLDTPEYIAAQEMNDDLSSAGFAFLYDSRNNETLAKEDKELRRQAFVAELDKLDAALVDGGGPFRLGSEFSGMDSILIPTLERWRYQLPITAGLDILENRPAIQRWFEAMDSFPPYRDRVAGDAYSWTATASMFLRYFGGGEDKPKVAEAIQRADAAAEMLAKSFVQDIPKGNDEVYAREAVEKLVTNREAVVKDCTRSDPVSQAHIPRASNVEAADMVLRYVASVLLSSPQGEVMETAMSAPLVRLKANELQEASLAARTVAARLCAPRDMSSPAARLLRGVLTVVADRLEGQAS